MATSVESERREFDKYLKFMTIKAVQVIVQSRQGRCIRTRSSSQGTDWFNLSIVDDKQVNAEMKKSLDGQLPQTNHPVCVEIQMETSEGDALVLEVWSLALDTSSRDVTVSVTNGLYPRLTVMLKSLIALTRTTPAHSLSRQQEEDFINLKYRIYTGAPGIPAEQKRYFKRVVFAQTPSSFGTISFTLNYRTTISLPDSRPLTSQECVPFSTESSSLTSSRPLLFPFAPDTSDDGARGTEEASVVHPFSRIMEGALDHHQPPPASLDREDSNGSHFGIEEHSMSNGDVLTPGGDPSCSMQASQEGYVLVNLTELKPTFAEGSSSSDDLGDLLIQCSQGLPSLDLFQSEERTDVQAALRILESCENSECLQ